MPPKKRRICAEAALENIMNFVHEEDGGDSDDDENFEDDLDELNSNDEAPDEEPETPEDPSVITNADGSDNGEEENDVGHSRLRRRQLTSNRLVNSIDACFDLEKYDPFPIPENLKIIRSVFKVDKNKKNNIVRTFQNQPPTGNAGRINRANVITARPGPQPKARETSSPRAAFELFFTKEIVQDIVSCTNKKIRLNLSKLPDDFITQNSRYSFMKETTVEEFYAWIGLHLYRGLYQLNTLSVDKLFSNKYGPAIFGAIMSRNRFSFIRANLGFDDETTRDERWKHDRFAAIRDIFEAFNYECMTCLVPGEYLSLDETLYPMRTQISFKQYNPNKPAKYGLLIKAINAAQYPYTFIAAPYCGKPVEIPGVHYVAGTEEIVKKMVGSLETAVSLAGRNISFDRLYTSITLALWLYDRNITCLGTMQANRKGVPDEMKNFKDREPLSSEIYWQKDGPLSMSSYVVKTTSTKKNVLMLSTLKPTLVTTKDDKRKKLGLYKLYDFTKGGTDIVDQRMGFHTTKTKSRKWTHVMFAYMMDTARVNSSTIFAMNESTDPKKLKSFEYAFDLVMGLVTPTIERRNQTAMLAATKAKIALCLGNNAPNPGPRTNHGPAIAQQRKRCTLCQQECSGAGYSQKKSSVPCVKSLCQSCGNSTCQKHMVQKCWSCAKE